MSRKKKDRGRDAGNGAAASVKGSAASVVFRTFGELAAAVAPDSTPSPGGSSLLPASESDSGHHERADAILVQKAMRNAWPVDAPLRNRVIETADLIMQTSNKDRNILAAAKIILQADKLNVDRERIDTPQDVNVKHSGGIDMTYMRQEMLQDPEYLAYLEHKAATDDAAGGTPGVIEIKPNEPPKPA